MKINLINRNVEYHDHKAKRPGLLRVLWGINSTRIILLTVLLIIIGAGIFAYIYPKKEADAAWYGTTGWNYRKKIVIDASKVSGSSNLTNFPILVSRTDNDLKASAQSDGDDILFTSSDGSTKLDHEIETYTSATGELIAWVEIPTLDYDDDTTIYMYYGNSSATSQENASGVWSNYASVLHLKEDASPGATVCTGGSGEEVLCDSSGNNNHGDGFGGTASNLSSDERISAKISYGLKTDSDLSYVDLGDIASTRNIAQLTISYWHRRPATNSIGLFGKQVSDGTHDFIIEAWNDANIYFGSSNGTNVYGSIANNTTTWQYLTMVFDGSLSGNSNRLKGYINDTQQSLAFSGTVDTVTTNNTQPWRIGRDGSAGGTSYRGEYDEARIYIGTRTTDWIATEYTNQNDPSTFFKQVSQAQSETQGNTTPDISYSMDESYGATLNSTGSNNHAGTISGALWRTEDLCVSGKCLYFDGSNDVVTTAGTTSNVKTVSFWVRPMTTTEQLVDLNGSAYIQSSSGTISATGFTSPTIYVNGVESSTLVANRWQHVTVTTGTGLSASAIKLAQVSSNYGQLFMDEFQLHSTTLSSDQVKSLYNSRGTSPSSVSIGGSDQISLSDGLVGYWKMDESAENTCAGGVNDFCDISGNNHDLTMPSSSDFTGSGRFGLALSQTGDNGDDYAHNSSFTGITASKRWTIAGWFKTTDTTGYFIDTRTSDVNGVGVYTDGSNTLKMFHDDGNFGLDKDYTYTINNIDNDIWNHIILTRDGDNSIKLFINGELQTPSSIAVDLDISSVSDTWSTITYGHRHNFAVYSLEGSIDDPRIYNRTLSTQEIQQLYNWAPGPIAHWKLDEKTGTTSIDISTNDNHLTLNGTSSWIPAKFGGGLDYGTNNIDGYLFRTDDTDFEFTAGQSFALSLWYNSNVDFSQNQGLISKGYGTSTQFNPWYFIGIFGESDNPGKGGVPAFASRNSAGDISELVEATTDITNGHWHHITYVRNSDLNTQNIYVNGILEGTTSTADFDLGINSDDLYIMNHYNRYTEGKIDDIKIFNYAQSPVQILNESLGRLQSQNVTTPIAHLKFNEGIGTIANNSGIQGSTSNGTLANMASPATSDSGWTNSGKLGKSLLFDGTDDYVTIPDNDALSIPTGGFTISAWFNADSLTAATRNFIVTKGNTNNYEWALGSYGSTDAYCEVWGLNGTDNHLGAGGNDAYLTNIPISTNVWNHLACVIVPDQKLEIYLNGKLRFTDTSVGTGTPANGTATVEIGRRADNADAEFNGKIDEVKIFNTPLTASGIEQEFNSGSSLVLGAKSTSSDGTTSNNSAERELYCVPGDTSNCDKPILELTFNEGANQTTNDTSQSGNNGTLGTTSGSESTDPTWIPGKIGKALQFDGVNDLVVVSDSNSLDLSANGTWTGWIYPTSTSDANILQKDNSNGFSIAYTGRSICLYHPDDLSGDCGATDLPLNSWSHFTVVKSGTQLFFYYNGISDGTATTDATMQTGTQDLGIGAKANDQAYPFIGKLDEIRIYDYARSPRQVAWEANKGKPMRHLAFEECSGTTIIDKTGSGNNATLTVGGSGTQTAEGTCSSANGAHAWSNGAIGKIGSSLNFDNNDDGVEMLVAGGINENFQYSWSTWIKPNSFGDLNFIFSDREIFNGVYAYAHTTSNADYGPVTEGVSVVMQNSNNSSSINIHSTNNVLKQSIWNHVTVTFDGSQSTNNKIKIYVNGFDVTDTSDVVSTGTIQGVSGSVITLGREFITFGEPFDGQVDEFRKYGYALTPQQIKTVMNNNSAIRF